MKENILLKQYIDLSTLTVYRGVLESKPVDTLYRLFGEIAKGNADPGELCGMYATVYYELAKQDAGTLEESITPFLKFNVSPYARAAACGEGEDRLAKAAHRDLDILSALCALPCSVIKSSIDNVCGFQASSGLPDWKTSEKPIDFDALTVFHRINGYGIFAKSHAFVWENGALRAIKNPDTINVENMVGFEWQREQVINNTRALCKGNRVNNILLYGDSGTGKSATVKSMVNIPEFYNLRIIELPKDHLSEIPDVLRLVSGHQQKFVFFIDDLSFENNEEVFSSLKIVLEGGLEMRPQNVVIYATSNRRHLVREYFNERKGTLSTDAEEEVHANETVQEKISLSERFGIKIPYMALNKKEFINLVQELAKQENIPMSEDELSARAIEWESHYPGRTPRTAHQFIDYLKTL
ncbi:MAG: ATP-binding protein [Bacillota bacterium]|nr:ATP-binding protein [Bacillota bacterium]